MLWIVQRLTWAQLPHCRIAEILSGRAFSKVIFVCSQFYQPTCFWNYTGSFSRFTFKKTIFVSGISSQACFHSLYCGSVFFPDYASSELCEFVVNKETQTKRVKHFHFGMYMSFDMLFGMFMRGVSLLGCLCHKLWGGCLGCLWGECRDATSTSPSILFWPPSVKQL